MTKNELIGLIDKGPTKIGDVTIEVTKSVVLDSDYIHIVQMAVNEHTTNHEFKGGWISYIKDGDLADFEQILLKIHEKMLAQAEVCKKEPLVLERVKGTDLLISSNEKKYVIQRPANDHFEICTIFNGEPDYPINRPVTIDGKLYLPLWSWYLERGCYLEMP